MCQALYCAFYVLFHLELQTTLQSKCLFKIPGAIWQKWNSNLGLSNSKGHALFTNNKISHQINNVWLKTIKKQNKCYNPNKLICRSSNPIFQLN